MGKSNIAETFSNGTDKVANVKLVDAFVAPVMTIVKKKIE